MQNNTTTNSRSRFTALVQLANRLGFSFGRAIVAAALALAALGSTDNAMAQVAKAQLTIGTDTTMKSVDDNVSSILFTDACCLTLVEGQTIRPVLVSKENGAVLKLGDGKTQGQEWHMVANSPSYYGTTMISSGNTVVLGTGVPYPVGTYSESYATSYGTVDLYNGATLRLPAGPVGSDGKPIVGETKIGKLLTSHVNDSQFTENARVDVGVNQTLTVEDGVSVVVPAGLSKLGGGKLQIVANGTKGSPVGTGTTKKDPEVKGVTIDLGNTTVEAGELEIVKGTLDIGDVGVSVRSLHIGSEAELDIQHAGKIEIAGDAGAVVFTANDGSKIDLYVQAASDPKNSPLYTSYVASNYNTYMELGEVTLNVDSKLKGGDAPKTMTVFSTANVGQTTYDPAKIKVADNILGRDYVVDKKLSNDHELVLSLERGKTFKSVGKTENEKAVGAYIDDFIDSGKFDDKEYKYLSNLENNIDKLDLSKATGELHASTVGFMYMNSFATTQTLFDMLRNNTLKAYSGADSSVAPMNYGEYGARGGAANGAFDNGNLYYNRDTNSYGPGVVPIYDQNNRPVYSGAAYNGENYGAGVGGMSGGSYMPNEGYTNGASYNGGYTDYNYGGGFNEYNGGYDTGYNGGYDPGYGGYDGYNGGYSYNFGRAALEASTLATYRAQEGGTEYGDPGTLIYSAWLASLGATNDAQVHKDKYGYETKQGGLLVGLDLFCSCDCRFGAYYGYQRNELKNVAKLGKLNTNDHLVGIYHQFGDETVYTIASIRGEYDRYKTTREVQLVDGKKDTLTAKYNGWMAGASLEHGANFAARPFIFSPYGSLDYDFLYRNKFTEESVSNSGLALHAGKSNYHSLRGQIGARLALDLYPGDQRLKFYGKGAYVHEFLNPMFGKTTMSFVDLPNSGGFNITGNSMGRDWADVGLGAEWVPIPALDIFLKTDYLFNEYTRNSFSSAGLKYCW